MKKRTKTKFKKFAKKTVISTFLFIGKGIWLTIKSIGLGIGWAAKGTYLGIKSAAGKRERNIYSDEGPNVKKQSIKSILSKKKIKASKSNIEYQPLSELKNKHGNIESFLNYLFDNKSTIGIILGARGTGKSAIGMFLLENFAAKTNKNLYALGFKQSALPNWIQVVSTIEEIENNSILLVDEGGIEFSSRNAMSNSNKLLSDILLVARHKDLSVMFITQNSSNLEVNAIRQADYLILKPSSLLQKDFERKKIQQIYSSVESDFEELKGEVGLTYLYSDKYSGFVSNNLPSFWTDKISKSYSGK